MKLVDRIVPINGADAMRLSRELARQEGIFVGITAGATFAGALRSAQSAPAGATVLCMLPDTGERYLSTPLFADVASGHDRRGARDLALDAELPLRCRRGRAPRHAAPQLHRAHCRDPSRPTRGIRRAVPSATRTSPW